MAELWPYFSEHLVETLCVCVSLPSAFVHKIYVLPWWWWLCSYSFYLLTMLQTISVWYGRRVRGGAHKKYEKRFHVNSRLMCDEKFSRIFCVYTRLFFRYFPSVSSLNLFSFFFFTFHTHPLLVHREWIWGIYVNNLPFSSHKMRQTLSVPNSDMGILQYQIVESFLFIFPAEICIHSTRCVRVYMWAVGVGKCQMILNFSCHQRQFFTEREHSWGLETLLKMKHSQKHPQWLLLHRIVVVSEIRHEIYVERFWISSFFFHELSLNSNSWHEIQDGRNLKFSFYWFPRASLPLVVLIDFPPHTMLFAGRVAALNILILSGIIRKSTKERIGWRKFESFPCSTFHQQISLAFEQREISWFLHISSGSKRERISVKISFSIRWKLKNSNLLDCKYKVYVQKGWCRWWWREWIERFHGNHFHLFRSAKVFTEGTATHHRAHAKLLKEE